jgi:hypothetical protein
MQIVEVRALGGHRLFLRFSDGTRGELDLSRALRFRGLLEPLKAAGEFSKVRLDREFGTIGWANGVELDTYVLYSRLTGAPLPGGEILSSKRRSVRAPAKRKRSASSSPKRKPEARRARAV